MGRITFVAALVASVALAAIWFTQRAFVYHPGPSPPPVGEVRPDASAVQFTTSDGLGLEAWWLEGGPTAVVVLHGNAGNRADRVPLASALHDLGLSVLLLDYRGYGGNPGTPSEAGLQRDGLTAAAWARQAPGIDDVVLFGESLGAAVAVAIAADARPDAVVLRSPFLSLVAMARDSLGPVPAFLVRDRWLSDQRIADVDAPLLIVASPADEIVPFAQSRELFELAEDPKQFVALDGLGHNDRELLDGDGLVDAVRQFLAAHGLLAAG